MAMTMNGDFVLPADKATVWAKLNDPDVLRVCIPGCQSLERTGDNGFAAGARMGACSVHNPGFDFNDECLAPGARMWVCLAEEFFAGRR